MQTFTFVKKREFKADLLIKLSVLGFFTRFAIQ